VALRVAAPFRREKLLFGRTYPTSSPFSGSRIKPSKKQEVSIVDVENLLGVMTN
jgi:hypothetical protein